MCEPAASEEMRLVEGCKRGERAAQKALFEGLVPYLRGAVRRYIWDDDVVQDVLQEAFIRIFRSLDRYDAAKGSLRTWGARIAVNVAITEGQKRSRWEERAEYAEVQVSPEVLETMAVEDMVDLLRAMPEDQYTVLNLHAFEGFNHDEIGEMMGITAELSRQRLSRARKWVKQRFEREGDEWVPRKEKET